MRASILVLVAPMLSQAGVGAVVAATPPDVVALDFDGTGAEVDLRSSGTAAVSTSLVVDEGGSAVRAASRLTQGAAVRLPVFDATAAGPRAVIKVTDGSSDDSLAPGTRDFSWAADLRLDAISASGAPASRDDGDNVVQRGLYGGTQFKLELDARRPACRLRGSTGSAGAVRVVAPVTVDATSWYRVTCTRSGDRLTVLVDDLTDGGADGGTWTRTDASPSGFGTVSWSNASTPMSVGGKLDAAGRLAAETDQFNGVIDNVRLTF